jgi:hypothetical protein
MAHGVRIEQRTTELRLRYRAVCRCGWSGDWRVYQLEALREGRAHREAAG